MAELIRTKKLSAREALDEHLRQIERINPKVNAIVTLVAGMAMEAAPLIQFTATAPARTRGGRRSQDWLS